MPNNSNEPTHFEQRPRLKEACDQLTILARGLGPSAKLPSMVELRSQLGFSMQTLNNAVRELDRQRVLRSVHGVGIYVVPPAKQSLHKTIGFVAANPAKSLNASPYWRTMLAGICAQAGEHDRRLLLIDNAKASQHWEEVDGVIVSDTHDPRDPSPELQPVPEGLPCVDLLYRQHKTLSATSSVTSDDFQGTQLLVRHLVSLGHRKIAYLSAFTGLSMLEQRHAGYLAGLEEAGIVSNPRWMRELRWVEGLAEQQDVRLDWFFRVGEYFTRRWLSEDWHELGCTALITQNDEAAMGAIATFQSVGMDVPRDVSVTGFDGIQSHSSFLPQLTTIRLPLFAIGQAAAEMLIQQTENPDQAPKNRRFPVQLIEGTSSAPPPVKIGYRTPIATPL